jgi:VWFA-related protein
LEVERIRGGMVRLAGFLYFPGFLLLSCLATTALSQIAPPAVAGSVTPASPSAPTQANPPQAKGLTTRPPESPARRDSAGRKLKTISLDVVVTDASGKHVSGLTASDFSLLDNHQPQTIVAFHAVDETATPATPTQAILLIDMLNNTFDGVAAERQQIEKFLSLNGGKLRVPVSIVIFSDSGVKVSETSRDGKTLIEALRKAATPVRTISPAMGGQGAIERFQLSLRALNHLATYEATQPGRKLLIWIGPGWPMLAGTRFSSSLNSRHSDWDNIVSFSNNLREARVALYGIDSLSSGASVVHGVYYQNYLKPVTTPKGADSANLALPVLAIQSGGRVLNGSNDLAGEIANCLADAETYYTLAFHTYPSEEVNDYHPLESMVGKAGLTARTNVGYYAQP